MVRRDRFNTGTLLNLDRKPSFAIEAMVKTQWETDNGIIGAYTKTHDALGVISMRALILCPPPSFVGAAHYVPQGHAAEHTQAAINVRHFMKEIYGQARAARW